MESKSELDRINLNNVMRLMPANPWQFDVDFDENAFDKLKDVMRIVAATSQEKWPSDDEWRGIIPDWVRSKMPELSKEETDRLLAMTHPEQWDSLPWDFLSWLDALRDRQICSVRKMKKGLTQLSVRP